jgi:hypothetical protein
MTSTLSTTAARTWVGIDIAKGYNRHRPSNLRVGGSNPSRRATQSFESERLFDSVATATPRRAATGTATGTRKNSQHAHAERARRRCERDGCREPAAANQRPLGILPRAGQTAEDDVEASGPDTSLVPRVGWLTRPVCSQSSSALNLALCPQSSLEPEILRFGTADGY